MDILKIDNLTKTYGKNRGVEDISFSIKKGEIFGFIGPNGAGKSTTIRTVLGLIKKNAGEITIFGKNIEDNLIDSLHKIGYLPSEVFYYDKLKVKDLLDYSASFYNVDSKKRIQELASYLNLDVNAKIDSLSLGNKKKVGIIQGLLHSPEFIILDEPTSGLDPLMQQKFFDLLKVEAEKGATILFSSHILSEVQRLCNRVAIIKEGKIIAVQEMNEMRSLNYRRVKVVLQDKDDVQALAKGNFANFNVKDNLVEFTYIGKVNDLLQTLGGIDLQDVVIEEPDLEEIFMHYYE